MKTLIASLLFATSAGLVQAQTLFRVTNVTVTDTEKEETRKGQDVTATIGKGEGTDRVVVYSGQNIVVKAWVKVSTHNVKRSSVKDSAVNVIFELDLLVDGKKDGRRIEKIFYGDQVRSTHIRETFTIKQGITVRVITVEFDGSLE